MVAKNSENQSFMQPISVIWGRMSGFLVAWVFPSFHI
jgi:L-asparagine transporter-like permease